MAIRIDDLIKTTREQCRADLRAAVISIPAAALILGVARSTIGRMVADGRLRSPEHGWVDAVDVGKAAVHGRADGDYNAARTHFAAERANIAKIKRERMESELVEAAMAAEAFASIVELVRAAVLAIPAKVATPAAAANDPRAVAAILSDEIERTLNALADTKVELVEPGR